MKSQPNGANPKQLSISNLINQTQENQNNKVLYIKKKGSLASKVAKFQQNQSNLAIPISIKQTQSYRDHKTITKLKISKTHQEKTKSTQLCKKPTRINNQS